MIKDLGGVGPRIYKFEVKIFRTIIFCYWISMSLTSISMYFAPK